MVEIRSIRLEISADEDFAPVLENSVADFARSLDLSEPSLARMKEDCCRLFKKNADRESVQLNFCFAEKGRTGVFSV